MPRRFRKGFTRTSGFFGRFGSNQELKFHDVALDDTLVDSGGTVTPSVNLITQGTGASERIGRKFTIRSINWRFRIEGGRAANEDTPLDDTIRVIMYVDKQANGATAAVTDILSTADFQSFNNLGNKNRFRTLMDRTYTVNIMAASGADATAEWSYESHDDTFFKKVNIPIEIAGTGSAAITDIQSNNIGVLLISDNGVNTGFKSQLRLRFSDN